MAKRFLNTKRVRNRYGDISDRTVDRWTKSGELPPPCYINGQKYWNEDELDARDEARRDKPL
jgi:predicted site-specific integrase-resolvase